MELINLLAIQNFFPTFLTSAFFLLFLIVNRNLNRDVQKYFYLMIFAILSLAGSDIAQAYFEQLTYPTWQRMLSACFSYSLRPFVLFSFLIVYTRKVKPFAKFLLAVPLIANAVIVFMAFNTPLVFSYTADNQVVRGPLLIAPFIVSLFYFAFILWHGIRNIHSSGYQEFFFFSVIFVVLCVVTILEMLLRAQGLIVTVAIIGAVFYYIIFFANSYMTDGLTGALIRSKLFSKAEQYKGEYSIILYDINDLKLINDTKGHLEGDKVLREVTKCAFESIPPNALIYRYGGDEFVIFIPGENERELKSIILRMNQKLSALSYSASYGYGFRSDAKSFDALLERVDALMYENKRYHKENRDLNGEWRGFDEEHLTPLIDDAFAKKEFIAYFQPQYLHPKGKLLGAEALARWKREDGSLVSPGAFIPLLEKMNLISKLDLMIFESVCSFLKKCMMSFLPLVPVSTNISRRDIVCPGFIDELERIRNEYGVPTALLPLEITESAAINGKDEMITFIEKLHKLGYKIEMDDFGSGYSSLNILKNIDFDIVKLDMEFLKGEMNNGKGSIILSTMIEMTSKMGMSVIAEGVENMEQADYLHSIGCHIIQGKLYSMPINGESLLKLLRPGDTIITAN